MKSGYFLTVCLNPVIQKTLVFPSLHEAGVNRTGEYYTNSAGKGIIVSRVLGLLGEPVVHLSQAGGWNREYFITLTGKDGIDLRYVDSGSEVRFCYTLCDRAAGTSTELVEEGKAVVSGTEEAVLRLYREVLAGSHTLIISGTKAPGFSPHIFPSMVDEAKKKNKMVILDFRETDLLNCLPLCPDVIKPNYREFRSTFFPDETEGSPRAESRVKEKMEELFKRYGTVTVLSRGPRPCLFIEAGKVKTLKPPEITPVNTTGCGDALTAGFASLYAKGRGIGEAVAFGLECARRNALALQPGFIEGFEWPLP
ncbi:MAG: bifunctional hydroxymethylpyrimidine kinase/phosphomethylpyrimidine kinase [Spirochaetales bacterium]|nr:bifunctional hydroxymethylpyrimidine kinase/phosphomethylpyrimidine kinase [Spirochaetales bacterium]